MGLFNRKVERITNYDELLRISKTYFNSNVDEETKNSKFFKKDMKTLENYAKQIIKIDEKEGNLKDNIADFRWVLPPWFVYPLQKKEDTLKTKYAYVYSVFLRTLSSMERSAYEKIYPIPEEWSHL